MNGAPVTRSELFAFCFSFHTMHVMVCLAATRGAVCEKSKEQFPPVTRSGTDSVNTMDRGKFMHFSGRGSLTILAFALSFFLASCGSSSSPVGLLSITPGNGTVFVGAAQGAVVRAARFDGKSRTPNRAHPEDFASAPCGNLQYSAVATYLNGNVTDVTNQVSWTSSNAAAATINADGNATAVALGITYINGTFGKLSTGSVPLYVDELNSIAMSPLNTNLAIGTPAVPTTLQFSAVGAFTQPDGSSNSKDISNLVTWSSSAPSVATIDPVAGLVTSVTQGTTFITATVCGVSGTTQLTVGPPGPASLQITPATSFLGVGTSLPFSAVELYTDGTTHPLTAPLQWSSSSTKNCIVSAFTGVAFGASSGVVTITATETGGSLLTGTAMVTVQSAVARFAYVANLLGNGTGSISSFTVNAPLGALTALASTPATSPQQVLLGPSGNFLYSIDSSSLVHVYQVTLPGSGTPTNPDGSLTPLDNTNPSFAPIQAGSGGKNIGVIDPTGQFLYVIDGTANTLYGFQIQQSTNGATPFGSLQPIPNGAPFSGQGFTLNQPSWIMVDHTGQFLYVVNAGNNSISGYAIQLDGTLLVAGSATAPPPTGNGPVYGTTDSQGRMFVANSLDNTVSSYTINADGTWTPGQVLAITGATEVINVKTDPAGNYLYVLDKGGANGGQVFAYPFVPPVNGMIFGDPIGQPQPVGNAPHGLAVDPSGVFLAVDGSESNELSLFSISKNSNNGLTPGQLTPATPPSAQTDANPQFVVFYTAQLNVPPAN
jgi:6-phosphogluconolactonase (cycloisomerase 2 family)